MADIHLIEDLILPIDLVTQTTLIVGKRGSGKSNTGVRLAEQFFKFKIPFVVIDPTDNWYGLKSSQDGKGPGLKVYIFGGRHGDLPLESTSGRLIADVLIDHRISAVLSVKHFSGLEKTRFVSNFAEQLFKRNTEPLHIFLEEAHEVAPQQPFKGEEEMLGRINKIWKLGRSSGLGGSAITQRPASLNKNITTQAEILIVHRLLGPQDVAAVKEWIKYHGESDQVLSQLAELKTGEAWLWAPDFPEGKPIGLRKVKILYRETFDSHATPKAGEHRKELKNVAPVDLDTLRVKMASTIEKAKQEDPKELRMQISELKRQIASVPQPKPIEKPIEIPVLKDEQIRSLEKAIGQIMAINESLIESGKKFYEEIKPLAEGLQKFVSKGKTDLTQIKNGELIPRLKWVMKQNEGKLFSEYLKPEVKEILLKSSKFPRESLIPASEIMENVPLRAGERRMLENLCRWHPLIITRSQLGTLSGLTPSGGTFSNYYGTLKRAELLIELPNGIKASEAGLNRCGSVNSPQGTEEVAQMWRSALRRGERHMLDILISKYPRSTTRLELGELVGLTSDGGTFANYLGTLRRNGLAEVNGEVVRAGEALFLFEK